jgi:hypothetical protein
MALAGKSLREMITDPQILERFDREAPSRLVLKEFPLSKREPGMLY